MSWLCPRAVQIAPCRPVKRDGNGQVMEALAEFLEQEGVAHHDRDQGHRPLVVGAARPVERFRPIAGRNWTGLAAKTGQEGLEPQPALAATALAVMFLVQAALHVAAVFLAHVLVVDAFDLAQQEAAQARLLFRGAAWAFAR